MWRLFKLFLSRSMWCSDLRNLEKESLCYSGGLVSTLSYEEIAFTIKKTLKYADVLSMASKKKIDGMGLERIANIIYNFRKNN